MKSLSWERFSLFWDTLLLFWESFSSHEMGFHTGRSCGVLVRFPKIHEVTCLTRSLQHRGEASKKEGNVFSQINSVRAWQKGREWMRLKSIYNLECKSNKPIGPCSQDIPPSPTSPLPYFFSFLFIWVIILLAYFWSKRFLGCLDRTHYIRAFSDRTSCAWQSERMQSLKTYPDKKVKRHFRLSPFYN